MEKYNLRKRSTKCYTADMPLPRSKRTKKDEKLYPIRVLEEEGDRVKIHYEGYSDDFDEWRPAADIVVPEQPEVYQPFHLHSELAIKIKQALTSSSAREPDVRISLPFDKVLFEGGLKQAGTPTSSSRGTKTFTIKNYSDLSPLLGPRWFVRGINEHNNYCYVNKDTVQFYLFKRKPIIDYTEHGTVIMDTGYSLVFRFVRMDCVGRPEEFLEEL